jgi:hypothetical protein
MRGRFPTKSWQGFFPRHGNALEIALLKSLRVGAYTSGAGCVTQRNDSDSEPTSVLG